MSAAASPEGNTLPLSRSPSRGVQGQQQGQKRDFFLYCCRALNLVTAASALLCGVALLIAMAFQYSYRVQSSDFSLYDLTGQAQRAFGVGIVFLIILVEAELGWFLWLFPSLDFWLGRGLFQVFGALLTYRETFVAGDSGLHTTLNFYASLTSLALFCCGCVYIMGGVMCCGVIQRVPHDAARRRQEAAAQRVRTKLEMLERRRTELYRQLGGSPV